MGDADSDACFLPRRYMDRVHGFCSKKHTIFCTKLAHIRHTHNNPSISDCDAKSRSLGPTLPIVRKERNARSLNPVNTVSRTSPTKGKIPQ